MSNEYEWIDRIKNSFSIDELQVIKNEFEKLLDEEAGAFAPYQIPAILNAIDSKFKEFKVK